LKMACFLTSFMVLVHCPNIRGLPLSHLLCFTFLHSACVHPICYSDSHVSALP
jgi:hypothetical protein